MQPEWLPEDELITGLLANLPRIRAQRILDMAQAIGIAMNGSEEGMDQLLHAAGMSDAMVLKAKMARWRAGTRERGQSWQLR